MTTNQTINDVPRELLASFAAYVADSPNSIMRARAKELKALLEAPARPKCNDTGEADSGGVQPWGEGINIPCDCKPAAQPQGEPVAEVVSKFGDPEAFGERELAALKDIQKLPYGTKLYAEQTPPVAVVLPERRSASPSSREQAMCANTWNACIDEMERLNPGAKP